MIDGLSIIANDKMFMRHRTIKFKRPWYLWMFKGMYKRVTGSHISNKKGIIDKQNKVLYVTKKAYESIKNNPNIKKVDSSPYKMYGITSYSTSFFNQWIF